MAALLAAADPESIVDALWGLGGRSRGGAEELAYLAEHEDPDVREALADVLAYYRGPLAKRLRARLLSEIHAPAAE